MQVKQNLSKDHSQRMARVHTALDGLSVGDAFGERFIHANPSEIRNIAARTMPPAPWRFTDDTVMALGVAEILGHYGRIHQDELARVFARHYVNEPFRGYGGMAHQILEGISHGGSWERLAAQAFNGQGSKGNGAAMRVAPVGAYFADDLNKVKEQAQCSAAVTHAHSEAKAGAQAVALATAWAWQAGHKEQTTGDELLTAVCELLPASEVRDGIAKAAALEPDCSVMDAVYLLGNGSHVTAPDTVPFCLWSAQRHLDDFTHAMWQTVSGLGDCDTNCAIVGGIVATYLGAGRADHQAVPAAWLQAREPLPAWPIK